MAWHNKRQDIIQTVMYALCVVYNPSNPHLALGPVCTLVADSACCAPIYIYIYIYIYMHEHWTVLNTDRNSNIVTLLFHGCAGSCCAKIWRIKTILLWRRDELTWIKNGGIDWCSPCHCRQTMWTGEWPFQIPWTFWGLVRARQPPCWLHWRERCHPEAQVDPPRGGDAISVVSSKTQKWRQMVRLQTPSPLPLPRFASNVGSMWISQWACSSSCMPAKERKPSLSSRERTHPYTKDRAMKDAFIFGTSDDKLRQEALAKDFTYAQVMKSALGY